MNILKSSATYSKLAEAMDKLPQDAFNLRNATEMMERDILSQSINAARGHQKFDWLELGISAATAGFMGSNKGNDFNNELNKKFGKASSIISSELQSIANSAVTSAATGSYFDSIKVLTGNLGSVLGTSLLESSGLPGKDALAAGAVSAANEELNKNLVEETAINSLKKSAVDQAVVVVRGKGSGNIQESELYIYGSELSGFTGNVIYDNSVRQNIGRGPLNFDGNENVLFNSKVRILNNLNTDINREKLAIVLMSEVSVGNYAEKIAVGNTVLNRMYRNKTKKVADVWRAYGRNQMPSPEMIVLAGELLEGNISDNTGGATHYYSPRSMPKSGHSTTGFDVRGGLEKVDGLSSKTYRPSFANEFEYIKIPKVREHFYKFYVAPGIGKVR